MRVAALGVILAVMWDYFSDFRFFFQDAPSPLGWPAVALLVAVPTLLVYPYFRNLKVVLYRIVLKSLLNHDSLVFRVLNRALVIRVLAFLYAFAVCAAIFVFLVTLRGMGDKLICVSFMSLVFVLLYRSGEGGLLGGMLAEDVSAVLGQIAFPFIFAWLTGLLLVAVDLEPGFIPAPLADFFGAGGGVVDLEEILDAAPAIVTAEQVSPKIPRIIIRHIYMQDLAVKSLLHPSTGSGGRVVFAFLSVIKNSLTDLLGIFFLLKRLCDGCDSLLNIRKEQGGEA